MAVVHKVVAAGQSGLLKKIAMQTCYFVLGMCIQQLPFSACVLHDLASNSSMCSRKQRIMELIWVRDKFFLPSKFVFEGE